MLSIGKKHIGSPAVMGILNVTPDSFSDGGSYRNVTDAIAHAMRMVDDGADIIDIGAESTRPGFSPISEKEEMDRLLPVIRGIREISDITISVDTRKSKVAYEAMSAGADILNDVNSFRDTGMFECASEFGAPIILMHCPKDVENVHQKDMIGDPIPQIISFFEERMQVAESYGIDRKDIVLDPGIGFGKSMEQIASILDRLASLRIGNPLLIAVSRKRVLSHIYPDMDRDESTILANLDSISKGADIVRVHDTRRMVEAIRGCTHRL